MKYFLSILIFLILCLGVYSKCTTSGLENYKYPIESLLGENYDKTQHYKLTILDEGVDGFKSTSLDSSDVNCIGNKDAVTDEEIFELNGVNLIYAEFYDDWSIKESIEPVFDKDGELIDFVTKKYKRR